MGSEKFLPSEMEQRETRIQVEDLGLGRGDPDLSKVLTFSTNPCSASSWALIMWEYMMVMLFVGQIIAASMTSRVAMSCLSFLIRAAITALRRELSSAPWVTSLIGDGQKWCLVTGVSVL